MQGNQGFCHKNLAPDSGGITVYKKNRTRQLTLKDFNQPMGLKLNPENKWVKKAERIPWEEIEDRYATLFPGETGKPAKPLRMTLGSLIIQKTYDLPDRELVEQIQENPYYQYFIGLPGYQMEQPYAPSLLVEFRKRLTAEILGEINDMIIAYNKDDDQGTPSGGSDDNPDAENNGTLILDATCAPQNISFPQDINLLNEVRENLEGIIDSICYEQNLYKPRMYRENARRDYLTLAQSKKRSVKKIRRAIKKQLQYIRRDRKYIDWLSENGYSPSAKQAERLSILDKVYEQQEYMYKNNVHSVPDRIVSISQPYIRPIVRGKAKSPVEFGAKLDISVEDGIARLEKVSFDAYNESEVLEDAVNRFYERNGHYPERVLADKIYRNRDNLRFCKEHGIRLSGPALGRPGKNRDIDKRTEYTDNIDRIEVERSFSLCKRSYGLGLVRTKLETTTRGAIALSIIAMNIDRLVRPSLWRKLVSIFSRFGWYFYNCFICKSNGAAVAVGY